MPTTFPAPAKIQQDSQITLTKQSLPATLYTAEQVRQLDASAINDHGIPGIYLMKRAGRAAFNVLQAHFFQKKGFQTDGPQAEQVIVFCGGGNNAGDGYIVAGLAAQRRIPVTVFYLADPQGLSGDAKLAYEFSCREGVITQEYVAGQPVPAESVIVDALLGIGVSGTLRSEYRAAVESINASGAPVLALDVPSGLCADTGAAECAVKADATITFVGVKQGLLTGRAPALTGSLYFSDLSIPEEVYSAQEVSVQRLELSGLLQQLPERDGDAHKGDFGHVMVIGGELGYAGAAAMAGEAAARMGAGLTSVATRPEHVAAIVARRPEIMVTGVPSGQQLQPLLEQPSVLVLGPGLGKTPWSDQMLQQAAATELPIVLDADGLNLLAEGRVLPDAYRDNWVLTPHPGEAARLLKCTTAEIQQDRFAAAKRLQKTYGGCVLLKGAGTVIAGSDGSLCLANVGNPGMASGGMGDVLSGVIGGLLAQGLELTLAVQLAVCLHGEAADLAAADGGQRGLLAADLMPYLRFVLNGEVA